MQTQPASSLTPAINARKSSLRKLLIFVVFNVFVFNFALLLLDRHISLEKQSESQYNTFRSTISFLHDHQDVDSLGAMMPAIHLLENDSKTPVYQQVFFDRHTKFQYPLTSLLPYYWLQKLGASDSSLYLLSKIVCQLCVCLTIVFSILIALRFLPSDCAGQPTRREIALIALAVGVAGLFYLPLIRGSTLGQIQTLLTLGFTLALYCWIKGRETASGILMGLMMLIKPQYALFFIWALLRKKFKPAIAGLICGAAGVTVSCLVFGFQNNLDYLQVLRSLSSTGESYYANQSANGLLNRLLFNGNNLLWDGKHFPPYNTAVYFGTMLSTLALLLLALFYPWDKKRLGGVADFACIVLISTMASPVAWMHHYAILLPILVWLWFSDYAPRNTRWATWTIAAGYLLTSNSIPPLSALASIPFLNILESYLYLGAILVLILLLKSQVWQSETVEKTA